MARSRGVVGVVLAAFMLSGPVGRASGDPQAPAVPDRAMSEVADLLRSPPGREGHAQKVDRYSEAIRAARSYAVEYADAPNLYELQNLMLVALQARLNLEVDAKTYQQLMKTANQIVSSNAPPGAKIEADLVLVRERLRDEKLSEHETRLIILEFVGRYDGSGVGEKGLMYGGKLAGAHGDQELLSVLRTELGSRPRFWDRPGVTGFLRRNSDLDLSDRFFSTTLQRLDGGMLQIPNDLLGKHAMLLFWSVQDVNSTRQIERLQAFQEKHEDRLEIVSISLDESRQDVQRFVKSRELDWVHTFSGRGLNDPFAWTYGITAVPSVLFADPFGRARELQGMYGWYRQRSSTAVKDFDKPIGKIVDSIYDFENFHDVVHAYLAGEFLVRMNLGLFSGEAADDGGVPAKDLDALTDLVHQIRNTPEDAGKLALARRALKRVLELEAAHPDAAGLTPLRNIGILAARVLSLKTDEAGHDETARRLAEAVAEAVGNDGSGAPAGLLADYVLTHRRLADGPRTGQVVESEVDAFVERYADGKAGSAAAIFGSLLAVQVGNDGMVQATADRLERAHRETDQARSFLRYVHQRPISRGERFDVELARGDGSTLNLAEDFLGKPVVVWFWTAASMQEHLDLVESDDRRHRPAYRGLSPTEHHDLVVIGVNLDATADAASEMMEGPLKDWIHARPADGWRDKLVDRLDLQSLPSCWLIDREGYLVADDMTAARLRSPILAAAAHQPAMHRIRERMVNRWNVLGPFHQRHSQKHTETGFATAPDPIHTAEGKEAWFELQPWNRWPITALEHRFNQRFSHVSFPPARAEREIDFQATYDDGAGDPVDWRVVESNRAGVVDLEQAYPDRPAPAIAYAVAYVHSETGGTYPAVFLSSYDVTVRVNGEETLRLKSKVRAGENYHSPVAWAGQAIERGWASNHRQATMPRQNRQLLRKDRMQVRLRKGWNELFIKTVDARGAWRFQMRLGDPNRTLRYALRPGESRQAFNGSLPRWAPPATDNPRDQLLEKVDGPAAVEIVAAARALGKLGAETEVEPDTAASLDGPSLTEIMHALDQWEPGKFVASRVEGLDPMAGAWKVLNPEASVDRLIQALNAKKAEYENPDTHHHRRRHAQSRIRAITGALGATGGERAVDRLVELFKWQKRNRENGEEDTPIVVSLVQAAEQSGHPALLEPLAAWLDHEANHLRTRVVRAMLANRSQDDQYAKRLIKAIRKADMRGFKEHRYLSRVDDPKAKKELEKLARGYIGEGRMPEDIFAIKMLQNLEAFEDEQIVDEIARFLMHESQHVRLNTLQTLGRLGFKAATPALLEALEDPANGDLRHAIAAALARIGDPRSEDALLELLSSEAYGLRAHAAQGLGSGAGSERSAAALIKALEDPHWLVRVYAAEALGRLGSDAAVEPLIRGLSDPVADVRVAAAEALGKLGGRSATDALEPRLADWRVGPAAAAGLDALGWEPGDDRARIRYLVARREFDRLRSGGQSTRQVLLADLKQSDPVGVNAAMALIRLGEEATIPELVAYLERSERPMVAAAMLNCGEDRLADAASRWVEQHDYAIHAARVAPIVEWRAGQD